MASTTETTRLGPADHGRRMSLEEFLDAEAIEGYRYELARGVLEVTNVPGEDHGVIVWALLGAVRDYERDHPGVIYRAGGAGEFQLVMPGLVSGRNPDIAVTLRNTPKTIRGRRLPTLVMEVVSRGKQSRERDHWTKREEYLAHGVLEYWIVDPEERRILVLIRDGDSWIDRPFSEGQVAEGLVLPGFRVAVAELLALPEGDEEDATEA
jgi:Uma2 family endonuclease